MGRDEDEQPARSFKVEDRRRFVEPSDEPSDTASDASPSAFQAPPVFETSPAAEGDPQEAHASTHAELNFSTFIMGLTTQALMHLGEIAEPGQANAPDLAAAKQMIDLLGILREKTTGNLDPDEEQLLATMLYDLRMRYVEVSRHR